MGNPPKEASAERVARENAEANAEFVAFNERLSHCKGLEDLKLLVHADDRPGSSEAWRETFSVLLDEQMINPQARDDARHAILHFARSLLRPAHDGTPKATSKWFDDVQKRLGLVAFAAPFFLYLTVDTGKDSKGVLTEPHKELRHARVHRATLTTYGPGELVIHDAAGTVVPDGAPD